MFVSVKVKIEVLLALDLLAKNRSPSKATIDRRTINTLFVSQRFQPLLVMQSPPCMLEKVNVVSQK